MKIVAPKRSTEGTQPVRPSVRGNATKSTVNRPRTSRSRETPRPPAAEGRQGAEAHAPRYSDRIAVPDAHSRMSKVLAGGIAAATALVLAFGPSLAPGDGIGPSAAAASEFTAVPVLDVESDLPPARAQDAADDFSWVTAETFDNMDSVEDRVELIGAIAREDYRKTGVLASITAAQMMLESGCHSGHTSGLAAHYNNYFGIKGNPDDPTTWRQSTWTGETACLGTQEQASSGAFYSTDAHFRVYASLADSVADHSSYLALATWDGENEIYPGLEEIRDPREAADLIAEHYATGQDYADSLMNLIETYDLTRFDVLD